MLCGALAFYSHPFLLRYDTLYKLLPRNSMTWLVLLPVMCNRTNVKHCDNHSQDILHFYNNS